MNDVRYLNVDLLLTSRLALTPIINSFGEDIVILFDGKTGDFFHAILEISSSHVGLNETIEYFCSLIEGLTHGEKETWDNCFSKIFDVGFESGDTAQSISADIRTETIKRMGYCGTSVRITVYPVANENNKGEIKKIIA